MNYPPLNTILLPGSISTNLYSRLISLLSENESWKKVAECFGIFSEQDIKSFKRSKIPAETLIVELGARLCTIDILCEILQECRLYNVLMLFKEHEAVKITYQPCNGNDSQMVIRGLQLKLTCKATGLPPPSYQWFCDNHELECFTDSVLCINDFGLENEGEYYCIISQEGHESIASSSVVVTLAPEKPVIVKQPAVSETCRIGAKVILNVVAKGHPELKYQWFKGNTEMDKCTEPKLVLFIENESLEGNYRCYVYNSAGEVWSNESVITVYASPRPEPSAKVAVLIANQNYDNLNDLNTPENDVKTLADVLQQMGFYTIAVQNLRLVEMQNLIHYIKEVLPRDAYVVFYFSGHGFEMHDKFMLPVDTPGPEDYLQANAVCEGELLQAILGCQPMLFLELLDMCLKPPDPLNKKIFQEMTNLYEYEANNNLIQGYATTSYLGAYETKSEKNGLYVEHLKGYLTVKGDLPIVEILRYVAKDIAKVCPLQKPFFGTNITVDYRLTDHCNDASEIGTMIEGLSVVPDDVVLNFKEVNLNSKVRFRPLLNVFLNTLEVIFTNLKDYKISCETVGEEVGFELTRINGEVLIKVTNLQRIVSNKTLTICLIDNRGALVDCGIVDIKKPMIAVADLWWKTDR